MRTTGAADAVGKLKALAAQGIRSIADPTVVGLGRYIPRIQRIAEQVPELHIIPATGCYTYDQVPFFFGDRCLCGVGGLWMEAPYLMVDMFVGDITEGIAGTGVKAAFLKCAIDHQGMTDGVAWVMRAVARAHRHTGAPVTVHTHPHSHTGLAVKTLLCDEEGVDPTRVVLGHSGDSSDIDPSERPGRPGLHPRHGPFWVNAETTFEAVADTVVEMCRRGYADRMVLAHDAARYIDWIDPNVLAMMTQWSYLHIHDDVLPYLREHGVTETHITTMLVETPRRYFEHTTAY